MSLKYEEDIQTAEGSCQTHGGHRGLETVKPMPGPQASPSASSDQLLSFVQYLRGKKIPVSPADTLDAVEVAELTGYANKTLLKNGLAAALAKSKDDLTLFEAAFDEYFHPSAHNQSPHRADGNSEAPTMESGTPPDEQQSEPNLDPLEDLRGNALFDAVESQDETAVSRH